MIPQLFPVTPADDSFLYEVYASSRAEELKFALWTEEVKHAFLKSQFEAQSSHYFTTYPEGFFDVIKLENEPIGRFYKAEFDDEIRIIDITLLPEHRNRGIGTRLLSDVLEKGKDKIVTIYLETYNPSQTLFSRLGFQPVSDDGVYCLWGKMPEENNQASKERAVSASEEAV